MAHTGYSEASRDLIATERLAHDIEAAERAA
jgi:hypothetical protein